MLRPGGRRRRCAVPQAVLGRLSPPATLSPAVAENQSSYRCYLAADGGMYLDWEATYASLQKLATEQGESLPLSPRSLLKLLDDRHRIEREPGSPTRTVRFTPPGGGDRGRYLLLRPQFLAGGGTPRERVHGVQHVPDDPPGGVVTASFKAASAPVDTLDMMDTFPEGGRGSGKFDADEEVVA